MRFSIFFSFKGTCFDFLLPIKMFFKVQIRKYPEDSVCEEIILPKSLPRHLQLELLEDMYGFDTDHALDVLTDRLYDLNLALQTQKMTQMRRIMMDSLYTFLCDLHDLCLDHDGFVIFK